MRYSIFGLGYEKKVPDTVYWIELPRCKIRRSKKEVAVLVVDIALCLQPCLGVPRVASDRDFHFFDL